MAAYHAWRRAPAPIGAMQRDPSDYADSQVEALKQALFIVFALLAVSLMLARNLPAEIVAKPEEEPAAAV